MSQSQAGLLLNLTATLGPFGLAFPSEVAGVQRLSCASLRGRPFVTGLQVQQLHAPLGGRDAYEFRIQCGAELSPWSALGPPMLLWASAREGSAGCPRRVSCQRARCLTREGLQRVHHHGRIVCCECACRAVSV